MQGPPDGPSSGEAVTHTPITRPSAGLRIAPGGATTERSGSRLKNARPARRTTAATQTGSHAASHPAAAAAMRIAPGNFAEGSSGNRRRQPPWGDGGCDVSPRCVPICAIMARCNKHLY